MRSYLIALGSTAEPGLHYGRWARLHSTESAVLIVKRLLQFHRKYSRHGVLWDQWSVAYQRDEDAELKPMANGTWAD